MSIHINQFPKHVQENVYRILATAISRAIANGTYESVMKGSSSEADEKYSTSESGKKAAL